MGDCDFNFKNHEVQHHIAAAAQHILMALKASSSEDSKKVISGLNAIFPILSLSSENSQEPPAEIELEEHFRHSEEVIMSWESRQGTIWDSGQTEAYLDAVVELQNVVGKIGSPSLSSSNRKQRDLLLRVNGVLEMAMSKLEEELIHILVEHKQYYKPEYMSFRSFGEDVAYDESFVSAEDVTSDPMSQSDSDAIVSEECLVDLVRPDVIPFLKSIAKVMFEENHDMEFCRAFIRIRQDALDEYLVILNMEQLTIEDTLKMDYKVLNPKIKKWNWALRIIIRVYLASEKRLCSSILGDSVSTCRNCFIDIAKSAILQFLNFGEAIAMAPKQPELLFQIIDMHEVLADLKADIDALFIEEDVGSFIRHEFQGLLNRLGDSAKAAFADFRYRVETDRPRKPFSGSVHPFTNYIMNYLKIFTEYTDTLNLLLIDQEATGLEPPSVTEENGVKNPLGSPLARHLRLIASILVTNLENRSMIFNTEALQNIFMINNIHYMVEKIKNSDLFLYFGEDWIRVQIGKYQHRATIYIRATWSTTLSLITDSGRINLNPFSNSARERCKSFIAAFEDVYKCHTAYPVPDLQLREDLQIYTSKVLQAYRAFLGRHSNEIGDKHIKYSADDLENYVLDFFGGQSKFMRNSRRR